MAEFYDLLFFGVRKMKEDRKRPWGWDITNEGGVPLGELEKRPHSLLATLARWFDLTATFGTSVVVRGMKGQPLMRIDKPFRIGLFSALAVKATLTAPGGKLEGHFRQVRAATVERRSHVYEVTDAQGQLAGTLRGDWRSKVMQIYDDRGNTIGKIAQNEAEVNRVVFFGKFYTVKLYVPIANPTFRKLVMCSAAAIDRLLT